MNAHPNPAIEKAMKSVAEARPKAEADPMRPVYHFRPPANWMNDPNGPIYHQGYYHLFYQHNPYGDAWNHMHWGHARSKDLVHWEHLPIALWPSYDLGEGHCFSGCAWVNGDGQPMLVYTKVSPGEDAQRIDNEQWAAISDDEMLIWEKHPANPILSLETHGGPRFERGWRDPYIFAEAERTFLVLGGAIGEETATVALYEAADVSLGNWIYRGLLCEISQDRLKFYECPNFFKVDGKWMLITSPYRRLEYIIGDFDIEALTFSQELDGILDYGAAPKLDGDYGSNAEFYASNVFFDDQDRCILLGWVRGFKKERGWNGCLALPRLLSIGSDGHPRQMPLPELQQLRQAHRHFSDLPLASVRQVLDDVGGDTIEIRAVFASGSAAAYGLEVRCAAEEEQGITLRYDGQTLDIAGTQVPFALAADEPMLTLHIFLDKSVMEVFVNEGRAAITRVIYPPNDAFGIAAFAVDGSAQLKSLDVWAMATVW